MRKEKLFTFTNVLLALVLTLLLICGAVVLVLNFRPLYYADIGWLGIEESSGLAQAEIRANYDALIDYNSVFYRGALEFPSLAMSETGRIHFEEVKVIFDAVQVLAMVLLVLAAVGCVLKLRRKKLAFLKLGAILALAVPAALGIFIAVAWQWFFVLFHRLFFNNNYWIFDAATDPVITILPDAFFMHCALAILGVVVVGSALLYLWYRLAKRRAGEK